MQFPYANWTGYRVIPSTATSRVELQQIGQYGLSMLVRIENLVRADPKIVHLSQFLAKLRLSFCAPHVIDGCVNAGMFECVFDDIKRGWTLLVGIIYINNQSRQNRHLSCGVEYFTF